MEMKDIVEIIDGCDYPLDKEINDEDNMYWLTIRFEQIKVIIDGNALMCSGIGLCLDTCGQMALELHCPEIIGFDYEDQYNLVIPIYPIDTLEVVPVTIRGKQYNGK